MGTLVNSEVTSKHENLLHTFLLYHTCKVLQIPGQRGITNAMYLESLYEGAPMHESTKNLLCFYTATATEKDVNTGVTRRGEFESLRSDYTRRRR